MTRQLYRYLIILLVPALATIYPLGRAWAFHSEEKTPEQKAAESEKKAVSVYNDGVKHMDAARSIGAKTDSTYAYNYRATSDEKAHKEFVKAIDKFTESIALNPKMPEAYNNLGFCYRKIGMLKESLSAYGKAIDLKSDFTQAHEYRGETYLALGDLTSAQGDLDFLKQVKSPYADTLAKSIEVFQLEKFNQAGK